jgi:DNA-binding transcriptional ArsR family regulator
MHIYPCIVTEQLPTREVRAIDELRTLAHPMRQRILDHLRHAGPGTSTTLARELAENSGIMSYHLRLLAEHGFVTELTDRGHGRERWWEASPEPVWIPREELDVEARAEVSGLRMPHVAADLKAFSRFRATRADIGEWGRGTWVSGRRKLMLTREQDARLIADLQALADRYQREAADATADTRQVVFRFLVYPEPDPERMRDQGIEPGSRTPQAEGTPC